MQDEHKRTPKKGKLHITSVRNHPKVYTFLPERTYKKKFHILWRNLFSIANSDHATKIGIDFSFVASPS